MYYVGMFLVTRTGKVMVLDENTSKVHLCDCGTTKNNVGETIRGLEADFAFTAALAKVLRNLE